MTAGRWLGWVLLGALLGSLAVTAALERGTAVAAGPGEATYLMQAESLVRDLDLAYERTDYDRLLLRWQAAPAALELASGSAGRRIAFDRPFPYALWLAPFVALWPHAGAAVANTVLLVLAAVLAARALVPWMGGWAPVWIAGMVFASATFAFVARASGEIFLLAVTVTGFSLLASAREPSPRPSPATGEGAPSLPGALSRREGVKGWERDGVRDRPAALRAATAGALLAIPMTVDWLYALLLAAVWWVPAAGRPVARRGLALGAAAMLAAVLLVQWAAGGGLPFAASSFSFDPATGYPEVDFPGAEWTSSVRRLEAAGAGAPFPWDPELRLWSLVDLLVGRSIGLLPYFAPLLLLALVGSTRDHRKPIVAAAAVWVAAVVVLRPFDVAGAGASLANPLFVPFYGALWRVADRCRPWRWWAGSAAAALAAVLFVSGLWTAPAAGRDDSRATAAARRWLPYETTQRWRLGAGAIEAGGVRVEAAGEASWVEALRRRVVVDGPAELVISAPRPLEVVRVELEGAVAERPEIRRGRLEPLADPASAGSAFELRLGGLRRRHAGWWDPRRDYRYAVAVEPPPAGSVSMRLGDAAER